VLPLQGESEAAWSLTERSTSGGLPPDVATCVLLAESAAREGQWRQAEQLIRWMEAAEVMIQACY
jgi:hypothetical protein